MSPRLHRGNDASTPNQRIWLGGSPLPEQFQKWRQTCIDAHPDWKHLLWTEEEADLVTMVDREAYDKAEVADNLQLSLASFSPLHLPSSILDPPPSSFLLPPSSSFLLLSSSSYLLSPFSLFFLPRFSFPIPRFSITNHQPFVIHSETVSRHISNSKRQNVGAKSDILRREVIYRFGGLYLDTDFECLSSFEPLHDRLDFFASLR
jgi:hypothetical protein